MLTVRVEFGREKSESLAGMILSKGNWSNEKLNMVLGLSDKEIEEKVTGLVKSDV